VTGDFFETDNCIGVLPINQNCVVSVSFRPTAVGTRTGTVLITDNASDSPQSFALSGIGIAELVMLPSSPINFPNVLLGQSSSPLAVTLSNFTSSAIGVSQITVTPYPEFSQTNNCGTSVAAQATCVVNLTFTPHAAGIRSGNILILDTNGNQVGTDLGGSGTGLVLNSSTSPTVVNVTPGQTATFTVFLGGAGGFSGTVSLSCTGGPAGSTCSTTPPSVPLTPANGGAAVFVNVTTPASGATPPGRFPPMPYENYFALRLSLSFLMTLAMLLWWLRRRSVERLVIPRVAVIALLIAVLLLAGSCGGGSSSSGSGSTARTGVSPSP
jgi:hypothetical protein